ncbi:bifunctional [glutamate--ammonia ligase]-adenylyl-L-tyrosine phosphorylase/[glutamate--ammonia-ligase] adenylyltransferase [Rhodoferax sp. OV413]|uniref:bifunctional [glutamate--ammonia ligase]-adenylyl-L-tyrosine phosphorylase/[glutamate--ammonia-ligase] adenylyltransferase n=1 Tax=Rhodoferax sp. OV413 TaxID=1855285 RepID=UPI0025D09B0C|nr:bifunctional [glutamate--ammonia ligase]-adenylyl-L-tyrosine phosphorylase/[glutamate--ammonia-ligase] adenylyltransferase [Rhodoferax sp. OV413]
MTRIENPAASAGTRFVQRIRRRYAAELDLLPQGLPTETTLLQLTVSLQSCGLTLGAALRVARQLTLERLATLDCSGQADVAQVTGAMTHLAEMALDLTYADSYASLKALHGEPRTGTGVPARLLVLGMGKLGARELNVSSDIDLIYVYDQDGETTGEPTGKDGGDVRGRGRLSNQEFFARMVRGMAALLGETTEHGFVFRVDLALRPNGNSGPPAVSLGALEEYFHVQGREWERFAWLKSRVLAPSGAVGSPMAIQLRAIVLPFVFRRYLDYSVFDALRVLHRQIREHAAKRSAGRPERSNDVKLSRGGIREIEFTVQLLQVVRGGQFPDLRTRPTVSALQRLVQAGLMPAPIAQSLAEAYLFLRGLEHRIQYLDDQQTHVLPTDEADLQWIAVTLGLPDSGALLRELDRHRELVAQEFDALLGGSSAPCTQCPAPARTDAADLDSTLDALSGQFKERMALWRTHPRVMALKEDSRLRLARLLQRTALWLSEGLITEDAALRLADWMEPLLRRESYLALLLERPLVHQRLLRMLGAARWPARYLLLHPGVIDELADDRVLDERFDAATFEADLERRLKALQGSREDDDENLLNLLRRSHHAEVFRTLARDVDARLSVEQVADDLSALAQSVLGVATRWCWARLKSRHIEQPRFAIMAYGKLGGKELGYGSDLDLVFVYDDEDERAPEVYSALVRKVINYLTVKTGEGDLYEIDTALRPNGSSGLLVTSFGAFANYQQQRGSNTAWTWEHQAITRARCVWGSAELAARFDAVREAVIASPRDARALREEIHAMRDTVRASHPVKEGWFDVKHSPGGMVDIEFAVQYLVLSAGGAHPELLANAGNIGLLQRAQACGLLPAPVGENAALAYRQLRQIQHTARLNEAPTQVPADQPLTPQEAGLALWQVVFGAELE